MKRFWIVIFVALLSSCSQKEAPTLYGVSTEGTPFGLLSDLCTMRTKIVCPWMGWFVDEKKLRDNFCRYTKTQSLKADVLRRLAQIR